MSQTIRAQDQTNDGRTLREFVLELLTERVTVRELLRSRVFQGVSDEIARAALAADRGGALRPSAAPDYERELARALEAFERGRILVLVDDRQLDELEAEVVIRPSTRVAFLRLVPLVGG